MSKNLKSVEKTGSSNLGFGVYSVYDSVLGVFHEPFTCRESELSSVIDIMVNTVSSKYWKDSSFYQLYRIGSFDSDNGLITDIDTKDFICVLSDYIDVAKRKVQVCIQTLNYLPNGYFKMPDEMKKDIQEKIDNAISDYCEEFIQNNPSVVEGYQMKKAGE